MQEYGVVTSIVSGQQSPHQFTISPSDRRALGEADMLIWIGADFEIYLADFFEQESRAEITLNTLQLTGLTLYDAAADQLDAHLWLDTGNASKIAEAVAERLSRLDEANASHYRQNLAHFRRGLENTNREISELLQRSPGRSYVVFHNAYQYFEKQFGLQHQFALLNDPETEPGIRQILSTRERISVNKPHCLLHEFTSSMELIGTMLDGYELKTVVVDLLGEKLSAEDGYIGLISNVAAKFSSCLY